MVDLTAGERYRLARLALEGLSVGDAFGQQFFASDEEITSRIEGRELPVTPLPFTDDTLMAASVCEVLARYGQIDQDALADSFWRRSQFERGYGASMRRLLHLLAAGADWRTAAADQFSGMGSHGNGAAMRVAPLGAYFHDDLDRVANEAAKSAVVTHTHPEGVAGAVAVAVASAIACEVGRGRSVVTPTQFLARVADSVSPGPVRRGIEVALMLPLDASVRLAVSALGNGKTVGKFRRRFVGNGERPRRPRHQLRHRRWNRSSLGVLGLRACRLDLIPRTTARLAARGSAEAVVVV
jgi:hypothetical protein